MRKGGVIRGHVTSDDLKIVSVLEKDLIFQFYLTTFLQFFLYLKVLKIVYFHNWL